MGFETGPSSSLSIGNPPEYEPLVRDLVVGQYPGKSVLFQWFDTKMICHRVGDWLPVNFYNTVYDRRLREAPPLDVTSLTTGQLCPRVG